MRLSFLLFVLIPVLAQAQAQAQAQTAAPTAPSSAAESVARKDAQRTAPVVPMASASAQQQPDAGLVSQQAGGSMLRATMSSPVDPGNATLSAVSFFAVPEAKPRTIKKHDLITIIVDESSAYSSDGTTALQKEADFDAKVTAMVRLSLSKLDLSENSVNTNPEIGTTGTRDFNGTGQVNRTDTMTTRLTGEVLDVKPNGTLVVQARQHIKTDDEEQTMILSGTCRVEDVTPDNTVLSTQMFDKDVTKTSKGMVRDATSRGWVPKLLDVINPF